MKTDVACCFKDAPFIDVCAYLVKQLLRVPYVKENNSSNKTKQNTSFYIKVWFWISIKHRLFIIPKLYVEGYNAYE